MISKRVVNEYQTATQIYSVDLPFSQITNYKNQIDIFYECMSYPQGPAHFEIIINNKNDPFFIDIAFRGGDLTYIMMLLKNNRV